MSTNSVLLFVPYVLLVIGKACKPIPVMILTALIARKFYTVQRYIFVTIIAFGVGLFIYKDGAAYTSQDEMLGKLLIVTALVLEGLLGAAQAKMRITSKPSALTYMFYINIWCALFCIPFLFINFEILNFVPFCMRHNEVILYITAATITGVFCYYFQSAMISNYGPLPVALVSTTRKFFTILCSSLLFGNVLDMRQWIATVIIFEALFLDALFGRRKSNKSDVVQTNNIVYEVKIEPKPDIIGEVNGHGVLKEDTGNERKSESTNL